MLLLTNASAIKAFRRGIHCSPGDESRFWKSACRDVRDVRREPEREDAEMSELTYVKIKWITSSRTSCWLLHRGVSASSQMVLSRHCLPSRQPYLKSHIEPHLIALSRNPRAVRPSLFRLRALIRPLPYPSDIAAKLLRELKVLAEIPHEIPLAEESTDLSARAVPISVMATFSRNVLCPCLRSSPNALHPRKPFAVARTPACPCHPASRRANCLMSQLIYVRVAAFIAAPCDPASGNALLCSASARSDRESVRKDVPRR
jgi:hypothetical protein